MMKLRPFANLKLRDQVLAAYIILLMIPMILAGLLLLTWSSAMAETQTRTVLNQTVEQAELHISYAVHEIRSLAETLYENQEVQRILKQSNSRGYSEYEEYLFLDEIVRRIEDTPRVFRVRLYVQDEKTYAREGLSFFPLSTAGDLGSGLPYWTRKTISSRDNPMKSYPTLRYILPIKDFNNYNRIIGCLFIDILASEIEEMLSKISTYGDSGLSVIVSPEGHIAASKELEPQLAMEIFSRLKSLLDGEDSGKGTNLVIDNTKYAVFIREISGIPWYIVNLVPRAELLRANRLVARFTAITIGILSILAALSAILVANRITDRIHQLIERMDSLNDIYSQSETSNLGEYAGDEVGLLQLNFDRMIKRIRHLNDVNSNAVLQKHKADLHALQSQINPHFLYNVLESINWMAINAGDKKISKMVTHLGRFYRLGLSGGRDVVTVGEEIEYVKAYLDIQNIRFGNSVRVEFDISDSIVSNPIVKLTLQPLVENAINHGLLTKHDQAGIIRIEGHKRAEAIYIRIKDDGIGVDFDKVNYLLSDTTEHSKRGFGIKNVDERLKQHFGCEYGLRVLREDNHWTVAEIRLPAVCGESNTSALV